MRSTSPAPSPRTGRDHPRRARPAARATGRRAEAAPSAASTCSSPACRSTGPPPAEAELAAAGRRPRRARRAAAAPTSSSSTARRSPPAPLPGPGARRLPFLPRDLVGGGARRRRCRTTSAGAPRSHAAGSRACAGLVAPTARLRRGDGAALRPRRGPRVVHNGRARRAACRGRPAATARSSPPAGCGTRARTSPPSTPPRRSSTPRLRRRPARRPERRPRRARRTPGRSAPCPSPGSRAWLARSPIFASAALYEPFGLAVLEAAQAGCALVLSDIPTFRELWDGAALFVPADDAAAFAAALAGARSTTPTARAARGAAAPRRAPRPIRVEAMADGDARRLPHRSSPRRTRRRGARRPRREDRLLHPFARLLLEPRQRPFPARRAARADRAAATRSTAYEPAGAWSLAEPAARTTARPASTPSARPIPELALARLRPDFDLDRGAATAPTSSSSTSGTSRRSSRRSAAPAARGGRFTLLFHDTHHRAVSDPEAIRAFDLDGYDGVLAFGETLAAGLPPLGLGRAGLRLARGRRHAPLPPARREPQPRAGLVWIGNWGDGERTERARELPAGARPQTLGLPLDIHGVRYPDEALDDARAATARAIAAGCRTPRRPEVFARHLATVHVPRRFYVDALPGIPTIRVFEALACGIPLVSRALARRRGPVPARARTSSSPRDGAEMARHLARACATTPASAPPSSRSGLDTHPRPPHLRAIASTSFSPSPPRLGAPVRWRCRA